MKKIKRVLGSVSLLAAAWGASLSVHAQTVAVPLTTIANAPPTQSGTLSNGVGWSVDRGLSWTAVPAQGAAYYGFRPQDGIQTWTFTQPVNISFDINGFQGADEGVTLPIGTSCAIPPAAAARFIWDPSTGVLKHYGTYLETDGGVVIPCTLANATHLSLDGAGLGPADYRRGLRALRVTPMAAMAAVFSNVPATMAPGQTVTSTLTCTNNGPGAASNVDCVPAIASGGGTIGSVSCVPAAPVATLAANASTVCTFTLTAPTVPSTVNLTGTATGGVGPNATATTTASTVVQPAAMTASLSGIPATMTAGATANATLTCTNTGPGVATNATCVPSVPAGSGTITHVVCTPAAPAASLASGAAISCSFTFTAPNTAGPVTVTGSAAGGVGPNATATTTAAVAVALAASGVQAVPTLEGWALGMLGALLAGLASLRRRRSAG